MRLLLDTHVLIWMLVRPDLITKPAELAIKDRGNDVFVSTVSAWEIAIKVRLGQLSFDPVFLADFDTSVQRMAFHPLHILTHYAVTGAQIRDTHKDPFDRMLAGQAIVEQLAIVTADPAFARLGVQVIW